MPESLLKRAPPRPKKADSSARHGPTTAQLKLYGQRHRVWAWRPWSCRVRGLAFQAQAKTLNTDLQTIQQQTSDQCTFRAPAAQLGKGEGPACTAVYQQSWLIPLSLLLLSTVAVATITKTTATTTTTPSLHKYFFCSCL